MQSVLVITSNVAGMICINGRMAGEVDADNALSMPVCAYGAVIVEHRPYGCDYIPQCVRLTFSGGELVAACLKGQKGVAAVGWPNGVTELELRPEKAHLSALNSNEAGVEVQLWPEREELICSAGGGSVVCGVPSQARLPQISRTRGVIALIGDCQGGKYVCVLDEACGRVIFSDSGYDIILEPEGMLRLERALDDLPGHAQAETWLLSEFMNEPLSVEKRWRGGAPILPANPEQAALSAIRAAQAGEREEASRFFCATTPCHETLAQACDYDGCVPMKYPPPGGEPCVGLVEALCDNMARIVPAPYRAAPGGAYGWQLESFGPLQGRFGRPGGEFDA